MTKRMTDMTKSESAVNANNFRWAAVRQDGKKVCENWNNPEQRKAYNREYYQRCKPRFFEYQSKLDIRTHNQVMAAMRRWETTYAKSEARCDSVKRIEKCIRKQPHECFWCGKKLSNTGWTIDHVTPLSKGGDNTAYNMVKCCKSCNCSKHDKMPDDWVRSRKTPLRGVLFQRYCNDRKVSA